MTWVRGPMSSPARLIFVLLWLVSAPARADDGLVDGPLSDLHGREPVVRDLVPRMTGLPLAGPGAELGIALRYRRGVAGRELGGGVHLTLPTDRWLLGGTPREDHDSGDGPAPPAGAVGAPGRVPRSSPHASLPLRLRPRDVRAAILAAQRYARTQHALDRLDDLATRARYAGLLPQLRLRATRLTDASESLSPTSYDADRVTASGGTSLWLEGRATWQLDRLLFATPEPGLERLRRDVEARERELGREVFTLLMAWQRHVTALYDPLIDPLTCVEQSLAAEQRGLELDWITGGWWSRWRGRHPPRAGRCDQLEELTDDDSDHSHVRATARSHVRATDHSHVRAPYRSRRPGPIAAPTPRPRGHGG